MQKQVALNASIPTNGMDELITVRNDKITHIYGGSVVGGPRVYLTEEEEDANTMLSLLGNQFSFAAKLSTSSLQRATVLTVFRAPHTGPDGRRKLLLGSWNHGGERGGAAVYHARVRLIRVTRVRTAASIVHGSDSTAATAS